MGIVRRQFGNRIYHYVDSFSTKESVNEYAKKYRDDGYLARVHTEKNPNYSGWKYSLFVAKPSKRKISKCATLKRTLKGG